MNQLQVCVFALSFTIGICMVPPEIRQQKRCLRVLRRNFGSNSTQYNEGEFMDKVQECFPHIKMPGSRGYQPSCLAAPMPRQAVAYIKSRGNMAGSNGERINYQIKGVITFEEIPEEQVTVIRGKITGMKSFHEDGTMMMLHVHERGVSNGNCSSVGGHFNPCNNNHSDNPYTFDRHVGDLKIFPINPDDDTTTFTYKDPQVKLAGPLSVLGRALVVHAGHHSPRVACGTIAITAWDEESQPQDDL